MDKEEDPPKNDSLQSSERMTHNNEENLRNILEKVQGLKESEISGKAYP